MDASPVRNRTGSAEERLTIDALTGLRNEHLFRLRFPEEFRQARERETNAALLAIKLDNAVTINAVHGRNSGDDALRVVAHVLESYRSAPERSTHLAVRLGGPLFGYYAPACSAPQARAIAEDVLRLVQQSELFLTRLDVSIGLVNLYEFFLDEGTNEQIALRIELAALHRLGIAEAQGANTICDSADITASAAAARSTVLVVEPEPASLELLVRALEAAELTVRVCEDGEGAISLIESEPPGVIIAEAMTPRLNGFTLRERLRSNVLWNAIPFILVSHKKNEDLIRKAVALDIRHYFRKPLSVTELVGLVTNLARSTGRQGYGGQRPAAGP